MADFGSWAPDLPPFGHDGLVIAQNVYPGSLGYQPLRGWSAVTADATVDTWLGGGAFAQSDGTIHLLAGTTGGVETYSAGSWTNKYSDTYTNKWDFAQFGDTVIGVADNTVGPIAYDMSAETAAVLGGSPPDASMIAVVRDFIFLAGDSADQHTVTWSAINNATGWTAGTNQSDTQTIPDGGPITALAGGEYGLVFQQSSISIFEYVGTPLIFSRRKISDSLGALTNTGIAQAGSKVFFLSNRGFYLFDDGELQAIGHARVDKTFFEQYTVADIQTSLRTQIEPNLNLVFWSMPGKLWIYNWADQNWSSVSDGSIVGVTGGRTSSLTLDDLQSSYGGIESVPGGTDDPIWQGGNPMLLVVQSDDIHYVFGAQTYLDATLQGTKMELFPGYDAHARNVTITGAVASGATITLACSGRLADVTTDTITTELRANGDYPLLARGQYLQPKIELSGANAGWDYVQGIEIEASQGGRL